MPTIYFLECVNKECPDRKIRLPEDASWPADQQRRSLLCVNCKSVRFCNYHSVHPIEEENSGSPGKRLLVFRISVPCWESGCDSYVHVNVVLPYDSSEQTALELLAQSSAYGLVCYNSEGQHHLNGPCKVNSLKAEVKEDGNWQSKT